MQFEPIEMSVGLIYRLFNAFAPERFDLGFSSTGGYG